MLFRSEDLPNVLTVLRQQELGESFDHSYRIITPSGEVRWIRDRGRPVRNESAAIWCYIGIAEDVTDRRLADERVRFRARVLECVQESVIVTDTHGTVIYWNQGAEALYGWPTAEATGRPIYELTVPEELISQQRAEEIMVFYPPDGYWRARPLPFEDMRWTAYGSSFLVGPVETQERPIVDFQEIIFDPQTRSFTLKFKRGGEARLTLKSVDQDRLTLDVAYSDAMPGGRPFAALRSMYTMETVSDAAIVGWRSRRGKGWEEAPVIDFKGANATEVWVGRHLPSRHNLSAPDMVFGKFEGESTK